jgi:hypothetical protein
MQVPPAQPRRSLDPMPVPTAHREALDKSDRPLLFSEYKFQ